MSMEKPPSNGTEEAKDISKLQERYGENIPPDWLSLYFQENPEMRRKAEEPTSEGYRERRETEIRKDIESENAKRKTEGRPPITFVGIHAAPRGEIMSRTIVDQMTSAAENVGVKRKIIEIALPSGRVSQAAIKRAVESIRQAEGFVVTTHTKRGMFNSFYTALTEALEEENLTGKLVSFMHTYDNAEEDANVGPAAAAQSFFESKGCVVIPYSFLYANTEDTNESWVDMVKVNNGVRLAQAFAGLTGDGPNLVNMLEDPSQFHHRRVGTGVERQSNHRWIELQERVKMVNKDRTENGQSKLNVLFVLGGEAPATVQKEDPETGEMRMARGSKGAQIANLLAKNLEFLGLETNTVHLAGEAIPSTPGDPNLVLTDVQKDPENNPDDARMQELYQQLIKADMVIFSTPVRWFNISHHLQKFIERTTPLEASGYMLEGKAFGTIATMGEAGAAEVEKHLNHWANENGMMDIPLGGIKHRLSYDLKEKGRESPVIKTREMAAMGAGLLVHYLAANGSKVVKRDFHGIRPPFYKDVEWGE